MYRSSKRLVNSLRNHAVLWNQWFPYLPTSSFQPHICRSPPGRGGPDQPAAAGERWRWPHASGPHPEPPGSWWSPSPASCGTAARLSSQSLASIGRGAHIRPGFGRTKRLRVRVMIAGVGAVAGHFNRFLKWSLTLSELREPQLLPLCGE